MRKILVLIGLGAICLLLFIRIVLLLYYAGWDGIGGGGGSW